MIVSTEDGKSVDLDDLEVGEVFIHNGKEWLKFGKDKYAEIVDDEEE